MVQGMASDRQTQCNRLVVTCTEDVVQDVLVRLETRTVCQDVLMKTWPQSLMMVVAPEQEEKNARAPPDTHLLKFFFKGVVEYPKVACTLCPELLLEVLRSQYLIYRNHTLSDTHRQTRKDTVLT